MKNFLKKLLGIGNASPSQFQWKEGMVMETIGIDGVANGYVFKVCEGESNPPSFIPVVYDLVSRKLKSKRYNDEREVRYESLEEAIRSAIQIHSEVILENL